MKLQFKSGRLPDRWVLPTGSYSLNRALGGGLESGRIHCFWGPKASTKSTQALYAIAEAQRMQKTCLYVDAEKSYDERYAVKCGVDVDSLLFLDEGSNVAEDLLKLLLPELDKRTIDVVVIDSTSSILQESFFDKPEANPIGIYARSSKFLIAKLLNCLSREMQIILISHASIDFSGYKPMLTAQMGSAQSHWTSNIIGFHAWDGQNNFRDDGYRKVKWKFSKTKQPVWPFEGEYYFNGMSGQVDQTAEMVTVAVVNEIIEQRGAWFYFGDAKFHGEVNLLDAAYQDLDFRAQLMTGIDEHDRRFRQATTIDLEADGTDNQNLA